MNPVPGYLHLHRSGILKDRSEASLALLKDCRLCPHYCGKNRERGELGFCGVEGKAVVASAFPHFGEEVPLVGEGGSGTIFFAGCNLKCIFCQNAEISWGIRGEALNDEELASLMLTLQRRGCENINLVSPTHVVPAILQALVLAAEEGLSVPLVYNTGGYDSVETLKILEGVIDIYMPDIKFFDPRISYRLSGARDYPEKAFAAVQEMYRQVGDLRLNERGTATGGLLVRHLLLPDGMAGSEEVFRFLAEEISRNTAINVMDQYHPAYRAVEVPELCRGISLEEFRVALETARRHGLHRFL